MHVPHPRRRQCHHRCPVSSSAWISCSPVPRPSNSSLPTPTYNAGACGMMSITPTKSRQPLCTAWSCEQLIHEHAITLGFALDNSTLQTYNSHLQSYLSFCKLHGLPLDPSPNTLSFYVIFISHHIQ